MAKIYAPNLNQFQTAVGLRDSCQRLGITITDQKDSDITHVLPLGDFQIDECVAVATERGLPYFNTSTQLNLSDKIMMSNLSQYGIQTLRTVIPYSAMDILNFTTPVLIKKRRTYTKNNIVSAAYKVFATPAELVAQLDNNFWAYQANPDSLTGEYVVQEGITGNPKTIYVLNFSVNANSDVLAFRFSTSLWDENAQHIEASATTNDSSLLALIDNVKQVCKAMHVKCALQSVQFILDDGVLKLIDWNFRPGSFFLNATPETHPDLFDQHIAYLVGISLPVVPPTYSMLYRRFDNLTEEHMPTAAKYNLAPIPRDSRKYLFGINDNMSTLQANFAAFKAESGL